MRHDLLMTNAIYSGTLCDSETNKTLSANDLEITDEQYNELIDESIDADTPEGHVRSPNGRKVYAPFA